jgi:hypothetical protein
MTVLLMSLLDNHWEWHILCCRMQLFIVLFKDTGMSTFLLLLFEPLSIAFDTLQVNIWIRFSCIDLPYYSTNSARILLLLVVAHLTLMGGNTQFSWTGYKGGLAGCGSAWHAADGYMAAPDLRPFCSHIRLGAVQTVSCRCV